MRALLIVIGLLVAAGSARADGFYFRWGYGGSDVKNQLAEHVSNTLDVHAAIGIRRGPWAVEGRMTGNLAIEPAVLADEPRTEGLFALGLDLKYIQPLSTHLEAYVRGGLRRGELSSDLSGRGLGAGAGLQLKGKVRALGFLAWPFFFLRLGPKVTAAVYVDAGYDFYRFHPGGDLSATPSIDAALSSLSFGFAVGSDF